MYRGSSSGCGGGVFDSRVLKPREKEMAQMDVEAVTCLIPLDEDEENTFSLV
jgi:hypothetical protein